MATDPPIGTRIKKRRQILGMTQRDLAERLDVSPSTVANWETGKHFPLRYLGAVEHVLGISLDEEEDRPRFKPVSDNLRREIAEVLGDDIDAQRYVIGVLEGTLSRPEANGVPSQERPGRSAR